MDDIAELHNLNLEWGCITNLMDKITTIEDKIEGGWPELIDMVADAMAEEGELKDPVSAFFNLYGFLFHLLYRLKVNSTPRPFNKYEHLGWGTMEEDVFVISDYNYDTFKWALKSGFNDRIDNDRIIIPVDKLTTKQRAAFDRRCK